MSRPDPVSGLRYVSKLIFRGEWAGGIVRLDDIVSLCPLTPRLPSTLKKGELTPYNSMANTSQFFVNKFATHTDFAMLYQFSREQM